VCVCVRLCLCAYGCVSVRACVCVNVVTHCNTPIGLTRTVQLVTL